MKTKWTPARPGSAISTRWARNLQIHNRTQTTEYTTDIRMMTNAYPWKLKTLLFGMDNASTTFYSLFMGLVLLSLIFVVFPCFLDFGDFFGKLHSWKYAGNVSTSFLSLAFDFGNFFWVEETWLPGWKCFPITPPNGKAPGIDPTNEEPRLTPDGQWGAYES